MSIRVLTQVWLCDLPPYELLVLQAIGDCADDDFLAHPSWNYLAWKTGISRATVSRIVKIFRDKHVLVESGAMANGVVVYRIELDVLPKKKPWRLKRNQGRTEDEQSGITVTPVTPEIPVSLGDPPRLTVIPPPSQATQRNKEEPSLNRHRTKGEQNPPETIARKLIEVLALALTNTKVQTIEAAVVAEAAYLGCSLEESAQAIAQKAMEDRRRGVAIDRWYFEDTKWRAKSNGTGDKGQQWADRCDEERKLLDAMLARTASV